MCVHTHLYFKPWQQLDKWHHGKYEDPQQCVACPHARTHTHATGTDKREAVVSVGCLAIRTRKVRQKKYLYTKCVHQANHCRSKTNISADLSVCTGTWEPSTCLAGSAGSLLLSAQHSAAVQLIFRFVEFYGSLKHSLSEHNDGPCGPKMIFLSFPRS